MSHIIYFYIARKLAEIYVMNLHLEVVQSTYRDLPKIGFRS